MLGHLGLAPADEAVYRAVLASPGTPETVAERLARDAAEVRDALERLLALGLVGRRTPGSRQYAARPPSAALAQAQRAREEEAAARGAELVAGRKQLARFLASVDGGADRGGLVELVDHGDVGRRVHEVARQARQAVRVLDRPPYVYNVPEDGATLTLELEQLAAGITYQVLYDSATFAPPELSSCLATSIASGEQARVMEQVPLKLTIADTSVAILPSIPAPGEAGRAVVLHTPALVEPLVALFDSLWERGIPVGPQKVAEPAGHEPNPDERVLITLLAAGLKDGAIARHLGTSERTVNRRISELIDRLDAHSRFQAGLQAARRGWL